ADRAHLRSDAPSHPHTHALHSLPTRRSSDLPRPMTDDYAEVIGSRRVTVAESHGTIVGVIVLTVTDEGFLIDNVAVDPSHRGKRSEEHTSELQSLRHLVCRLLLEKKKAHTLY